MPAQPIVICNGSLGFSFLIGPNGVGGTFPKLYSVLTPSDFNLKEPTSDFAPTPIVQTGDWASDPGDNVFPSGSRDYTAPAGDNSAPNNIRLSQIPIFSLTASHGISRGIGQENLPTSSNFGDPRLNTAIAGPNANPSPTIGDIGGFARITISLLAPASASNILLCGGVCLNLASPKHTFNLANLGLIQIVNLRIASEPIGVHCEVSA